MLPFTREQFIGLFASYNLGVWPMQMPVLLLGAAMVACIARPSKLGDKFVGLLLSAFWIWTGIAYHALVFSRINDAAWLFAALFVLQGVWLFRAAVLRDRLRFDRRQRAQRALGWGLTLYAGVLYPLAGAWLGVRWPDMPTFGITPCPLTIFTFGVLLLARRPLPRGLFIIPLAWSLVGGSAAFLLDMPPDWVLLLAGLAVTPVLVRRRETPSLALR